MTCLITLMLLAFALPATHSGPDHLKTGVLRSQAAALPSGPEARGGGPRPELVQYESPADLRRAVRDREISGGFVVGRQAVTVYTATAGGPPAANAVRAMGEAIAGQAQLDVDVTDLAPFPSDDPQGTGLSAAALPMILGGIIPAVGFLQLFPGRRRVGLRLVGAGLFSLFAGFAVATVLSRVTGTLDGPLVPEALGLALGMAALSYTFLGLHAVLGMAGLGAGVGTMMLLGNPLSGLATGDDWLPGGWATLGQLLPPGASGSLLRGTAYFDGAGTTAPLLVLVGWVLLGLTLALVANLLPRRGSSRPA
ncbi:hypothetical protein MTQ01_06635 [Streptomyces sp. XM4193]|uniref:hypothetical protein n=1 Tax=Streptomyces sp. XM4193 TaxID=2929782 RepID=UPI001FFA6104|nr:hypothetical protein [Streptomyces sp. XM4193]MCK1795690.1 hypothetical protein [Streptomyces sp. XM4193]